MRKNNDLHRVIRVYKASYINSGQFYCEQLGEVYLPCS